MHIISVFRWPLEYVREIGGWRAYLRALGWRPGEKTISIFDDAHPSYEDVDLWGQFFKDLRNYDDRFAIAFAKYGSPTSCLSIRGIPISVSDSQTVALRPIDHGDGLGAVGLLFSRTEFDDLVCKQFSSSEYYFHPSFFDAVFHLTGGHMWEKFMTL